MKPKIVFLVGPTASGKTHTAVQLAKKINAEIISCDSMQVYQGMDILTSMPPLAAQKKIPHHLIDFIPPEREYNVSRFRREAVKKMREIIKKGRTPLFVGGTGLYVSVVIDGIFKGGEGNPAVRKKLYTQSEKSGGGYLYSRLKKIDPEAAAKIHPHDTRRVVRALEVYYTTGKQISLLQKQRKGIADEYDVRIFCLNPDRTKLYERIDRRVDRMFSLGLVGEVKRILKNRLSQTAEKAIGIREVGEYLEGHMSLQEAKNAMKRNTRLYAKRQLTWFRKDKRTRWIEVGEESLQSVVKRIVSIFGDAKYCVSTTKKV
jgi:tRNA dimethylallyltransferase